MKKTIRLLKEKIYLLIAVIVLIIVIIGIFVFRKNSTTSETITISHSDFINQVSISGKVIPSESVDLGFYQGGRISSVKEGIGDHVSIGDVIASVENGDLRAALLQKQAALLAEQAKLKSLQLGTRSEQIAVTESSVLSAEVAENQLGQSLVNTISDAYTKSDDAIKNKIDQFFQNALTNSPTIIISANDSNLIAGINADRIAIGTMLDSWKKSITQIDPKGSLDQNIFDTQDNLNRMKSFLAEVSSITNNTTSTYQGGAIPSAWKSDTSTARLNIDTAISNFSTSATAYKNAEAALATAESTLKLQKAGATAEDIAAEEAQVQAAEANVTNAEAMLDKTIISAPFNGEITRMDAKVGEIASPNISLISMMSSGTFQIESYVPEVNISKIQIGQNSKVTLDAYGDGVVFNAKVISIDPAETVRDGVSTYKTKLQFLDRDVRIKPGMTANISVTVFDKPNTITIPQGVIIEKNGKTFVQVKKEDDVSTVEITIGEKSSLGQVEVLSGLSDGEIVILNPATN